MKKFTQWVDVIREAEERKQSELQKSYKEYFSAKLNKFGAKSPADLTAEQKTEFFNEIKKDWEKGQGAKPAGQKDVEEHGVKESVVFEGKGDDLARSVISSARTKMKNLSDDEVYEFRKMIAEAFDLKINESEKVNEGDKVNEEEVKNAEDFKEYAMAILKKQHGDDFDEAKAEKIVKDLSDEAEKDGDWGAAVGKLQNA